MDKINKLYSKTCGSHNKKQLQIEMENREELANDPDSNEYLYPTLDDPNFIIKIAEKKKNLAILDMMGQFMMLKHILTF